MTKNLPTWYQLEVLEKIKSTPREFINDKDWDLFLTVLDKYINQLKNRNKKEDINE